jgi:hypothetical protein
VTKETKMATTEGALAAQRKAISLSMGTSLGTYLAKWAGVRFSRFEPEWSQSLHAFTETCFTFALSMERLKGSIDSAALRELMTGGQPVTGDDLEFATAMLGEAKLAGEFVLYWAKRLPRRRIDEFGQDTSSLCGVIDDAAKKVTALASP